MTGRLAGHGLRHEGRIFDARLNRFRNGEGSVRCECLAMSPVLPSTAARKRWHQEHKEEIRATR